MDPKVVIQVGSWFVKTCTIPEHPAPGPVNPPGDNHSIVLCEYSKYARVFLSETVAYMMEIVRLVGGEVVVVMPPKRGAT